MWIVQHVASEGPGVFGRWLSDDGVPTRLIRPFAGERLPRSMAQCRGLVVLGGPMHVDEVERYPWLTDEVRVIRQAVAAERPVLGICLGAQLIAKAHGARVWRGSTPEVGWLEVEDTDASRQDGLFAAFPQRYTVFQWHGDTCDLPKDAVHLARSPAYPHQAFRLGDRVYALQYHLEVTPAIVEEWLSHDDPLLTGIDVPATRRETPVRAPTMEILARQFYSCWRTLLA